MREKITKRAVDGVGPGPRDIFIWDSEVPGLGLRVRPPGTKWYVLKYRSNGRQRWLTIGRHGAPWTPDLARRKAIELLGQIVKGQDPAETRDRARRSQLPDDKLDAIAALFIERYARKHNRRWRETDRIFRVYVSPWLGRRPLQDIKRSDIVELLDHVEDHHGRTMANHVLAAIRKLFNWAIAERAIVESSPIVRGMARGRPVKRDRVLGDAEIHALWQVWSAMLPPFGPIMKFLMLTGQRRNEVANLRWADLDEAVTLWTIPAERYKTNRSHVVPLSPAAAELVTSMPRQGEYVFSSNGKQPVSGWSKAKRRAAELAGVFGWRIHDLRRTAKTLMTRARIDHFIADRVLGHVIPGVQGIYDRYDYLREKHDALAILAREIERIVEPSDTKVIPLSTARTVV